MSPTILNDTTLMKLNINQKSRTAGPCSKYYPFQPSVAFHIKTSHLFCTAEQMTAFYMKCNTGLEWANLWGKSALVKMSNY